MCNAHQSEGVDYIILRVVGKELRVSLASLFAPSIVHENAPSSRRLHQGIQSHFLTSPTGHAT